MTPLPKGWARAHLSDVAERVTDGTHQTPPFEPDGVPFLVIGNVVAGVIDWESVSKWVSRKTYDECTARCRPARGDVLYTAVGSFGVAVPVDTDRPFMFQRHIAHIKPFAGAVDPRLLAAFLNGPDLRRLADDVARGVAQRTVTLGDLKAFPIPVPPTNEQRRIVARLEELLAGIRRAKGAVDAVPPLLEKLRQSILAAAFRGDLTADWRAKNPDVESAEKLLTRVRAERRKKWEEAELAKMKAKGKASGDDAWTAKYMAPEPVDAAGLPELPEGWCWVSAEDICHDITVGHVGPMEHRYVPAGVPFLRSQNVRANRYDPTELRYIGADFHAELAKSRLRPGDLVVVRSGAPGTACVIPDELADANCADLVIARLVSLVEPHVMAFYMNSAWARGAVFDAQVGVAQQHFNVGAMRTLHMPLMPSREQVVVRARLTAALAAISMQLRYVADLIQWLASLERALLAKAFRGELVPQDPNDEPADVMLARLRVAAGQPNGEPGAGPRGSRSRTTAATE